MSYEVGWNQQLIKAEGLLLDLFLLALAKPLCQRDRENWVLLNPDMIHSLRQSLIHLRAVVSR